MNKIQVWLKNPIITGSLVMIIGANLGSVLNYFYHFIIGRLLGPSSYGELATLFSVLVLLSIIPNASGLVIIKSIAISKDSREISGLINFFRTIIMVVAVGVLIFGVLFSSRIGNFLKIEQPLLFILVIIGFLISNLAFVNKSVLQGLVRFKEFVLTGLFENSLKLVLGVFFVWIGWSVFGAMIGVLFAYVIGWLISWWLIREYGESSKFNFSKFKPVIYFTIPVFIQSVTATSLFTADMILVKHFFTAYEAGIYAAISSLAKIVLFASGPVGAVMFPWIAKKQSRNENYWNIFDISMCLTILICLGLLGIYYFLPFLAIQSLYGSAYFGGASLLFMIGLSLSLLTISVLLLNFFLSIGKTWIVVLPMIAAISQIIGINLWHKSLIDVINVSIVVCGGLLIGLFIYLITFRYKEYKTHKV